MVCLIAVSTASYAAPSTLSITAFAPAAFCQSATRSLTIAYTGGGTLGNFNAGNTFTVQLSDNTGSFAVPRSIGTSAATTARSGSVTISVTIPSDVSGTGFRMRLVSSTPSLTSSNNNGTNITINTRPTTAVLDNGTGSSTICAGGSLNLTITVSGGASPYDVTYTGGGGGTVNNVISGADFAISPTSSASFGLTSVTDNNGCTATTPSSTATATVNSNPTVSITGSNSICVNATTALSPTAGGTWASSNSGLATVTNAGAVTAVSAGSPTFTFTNSTTGCSATTAAVTVKALPVVSITGSSTICVGATTNLTPTTGGTWASSNTGQATVTNAGVVTGAGAGSPTFTFTNTTTTCTATTPAITVNTNPTVSITGSNSICVNATTNLSPTTGGTWASSNSGLATVTNAGAVTGVSAGSPTFTFTNTTTNCSATTAAVTVKALPSVSITGSNSICVNAATNLSPTTGGTWASSNTGLATVTNAGVVTAVSAGTPTFTFTNTTTNCSATTAAVTVKALPSVSITGSNSICVNATTNLSPTTGGTWASSNSGLATVTNAGVVTGVGAGTPTFTFTNTTTNCAATTAAVTVSALPTVSITGSSTINAGGTTSLSPTTGGTWVSSNTAIATVTNAGVVTGVSGGVVTFTFTNTAAPNCSRTTSSITVLNLLDQAGLGASAPSSASFSVRKLSSTYNGAAMEVRRSSDDATADVAFASGVVATTSTVTITDPGSSGLTIGATMPFSTFYGSDNCYVVTWYDQTGNERHASQATTSRQPRIVNAGALENVNGKLSIYFEGGTQFLATPNFTAFPTTATFNAVAKVNNNNTSNYNAFITKAHDNFPAPIDFYFDQAANHCTMVRGNGGTTVTFDYTTTIAFDANLPLSVWTYQGSASLAKVIYNNASVMSSSTTSVFGDDGYPLMIGSRNDLLTGLDGWISESANFVSISTSDLATLHNNQMPFFNFYPTIFSGTASGTISACSGVASANQQTFTVSGGYLSADITVTAPTGFQVATSAAGTYSSSLILTKGAVSNAVAPTTIYVRSATTASVGSISGNVTLTSSGATTKTVAVSGTIYAYPTVSITGNSAICSNGTTTLSPTTGGTWASSNTGVATVSNAGLVTGVAAGSATFTFTNTTSGCSSTTSTVTLTAPPAATISYAGTPFCTTTATGAVTRTGTAGGTYTASPSGLTINSSTGAVTPTSSSDNTYTVSYTMAGSGGCANVIATTSIDINTAPGLISPATVPTLCRNSTYALSVSPSGGTWSSANSTRVAVDPATGIVTAGNSTTTTAISYTIPGCAAVSRNVTPSTTLATTQTITGTNPICIGSNYTYTGTTTNGTSAWSSTVTSVASVGASTGIVNGAGAGNTIVNYAVIVSPATCYSATTKSVTVNALPTVSIAGATSICVGATTSVSPTTGGTWASSNTGLATVTNAGVVTGVAAGSPTFTFTETATGCANTTSGVTVNALPVVSAGSAVCVGSTITLSPTTGGTWVSNNTSLATVTNAGVVTGVAPGSVTFTFTNATTNCSATTAAVTVNAVPSVSITGVSALCVGATTSLSPTSGGTWASSNTGLATVTNAGVVTGVAAGSPTFTFTNTTTNCSATTAAVTVNALPSVSITGSNSICVGATTALSPTSGGTWVSSNTGLATVTNAGVVTGVAAGSPTFTFTNTTTNCSATTAAVTIKALPSVSVTGGSTLCVGATTSLSPTSGGTWASSNTGLATVTNAGVVTGVAAGSPTFTFTNTTTNCSAATAAVTVNALPSVSITGSNSICVGATTALSPTSGGTWASSNTGLATVTNAGVVTGVAAGSPTFTFTNTTTNCQATTAAVTIKALPSVSITGSNSICVGATTALSPTSGGTWASSSTGLATVTNAGVVTGVAAGSPTFTFTNTTTNCQATTAAVTIKALPTVSITGSSAICIGATTTLSPTSGGTWISSNTGLATVTNAGVVTGVAAGSPTFTFTNTTTNCSASTSSVTVHPTPTVSTPSDQTRCNGVITTAEVLVGSAVSGTTYNWTNNNTSVGLAASGSATVPAFTATNSGTSPVTATVSITPIANGCSGTTVTYNYIVNPTVAITTQPVVSTICSGDNTTFTAAATGVGLTYQWRRWGADVSNGGVYSGATTTMLTLTGVTVANAGDFSLFVSSTCGTATSNSSTLTINTPPAISSQPSDNVSCNGGNVSFAAVASGGNLSYLWKENGVNITNGGIYSGATSATLTLTGASTTQNGKVYSVVVSNGCTPNATSSNATLTIIGNVTPAVSISASASTICPGTLVTFTTSTGNGGGSPTFQWKINGSNVGTSTSSYSSSALANGDVVSVVMTSDALCLTTPTATSNTISITHKAVPTVGITGNSAICVGATTTLSPTTGGTWISNNGSAASVTNAGLVTGISNGSATFTFTNTSTSCSATTSAVTINALPIVGFTGATSVCVGGTTSLSPTSGGAWASSNTSLATVTNAGVVTSLATGSPFFTFTQTTTGCSNSTSSLTINPVTYQWKGTTNTDWFTTSNWGCGIVPTSSSDATILTSANDPFIGITPNAVCKNLSIANGATLTMGTSGELDVYGDWSNAGTFVPSQGTVAFLGSAAQQLNNTSAGGTESFNHLTLNKTSGTLTVADNVQILAGATVSIQSGTLDVLSTKKITLRSSAPIAEIDQTARLGRVSGVITSTSNFVVERYVGSPSSRLPYVNVTNPAPTIFLTSPVVGATLTQWMDDFNVLFSSNSSTVAGYSELNGTGTSVQDRVNKGWRYAMSSTSPLTVGKGFKVFAGLDNSNDLVSVQGTVVTGTVNLPVTYTVGATEGWNLLGNPYPCEIDWQSVYNHGLNSTVVDPVIYIMDPMNSSSSNSTYYVYQATTGISVDPRNTTGRSNSNGMFIASSQAFFAKAKKSGNLSFTESVKPSALYEPVYGNFRQEEQGEVLRINVSTGGLNAQAVVHMKTGATNGFESTSDAETMSSGQLIIYTKSAGKKLIINGLANLKTAVPLVIESKLLGKHSINVTEMGLSTRCYLYDSFLDKYMRMTEGAVYEFDVTDAAASSAATRFTLVNEGGSNVVTEVNEHLNDAATFSMYPSPFSGGMLQIKGLDGADGIVNVAIIDVKGEQVMASNVTCAGGQLKLSLSGSDLSSGVYTVKCSSKNLTKIGKLVVAK